MNFYNGNIEDLSHDSISGMVFGDKSQITILGHIQIGYKKTYTVKCSICSQDPELYGKGLFTCSRVYLNTTKLPCGCSPVPKWNEDQQLLNCKRVAIAMGYKYLGIEKGQPFTGQTTRVNIECSLHGIWNTTIRAIVNNQYGCRKCADESLSLNSRKPDDIMIQGFLDSGAYHPETIFYRSERKTTQGSKNFWWLDCPVCGFSGEAMSGDLKRGNQPCQCVKNQRQSYINLVSDGQLPVAIKFGIAKDYKSRIPRQNKRSIYDVTNLKAWEFPTKESCVLAELECKQSLICGIVPREEMPDGFSETTHVYNLDKISEIFEKHGGVTIH